jgi:hypothetical protein
VSNIEILRERAERLTRLVEKDFGPGKRAFLAVYCDGCGRIVTAQDERELEQVVMAWKLDPLVGDDYCPDCK